jgi:hypothetical protein
MSKFRKKPVVIEAAQWEHLGDHPMVVALPSNHPAWNVPEQAELLGWIEALEGGFVVHPMDWIIRGVQGEYYACKPDIFAKTYEPADAAVTREREAEAVETSDRG